MHRPFPWFVGGTEQRFLLKRNKVATRSSLLFFICLGGFAPQRKSSPPYIRENNIYICRLPPPDSKDAGRLWYFGGSVLLEVDRSVGARPGYYGTSIITIAVDKQWAPAVTKNNLEMKIFRSARTNKCEHWVEKHSSALNPML